MQIQAGNKYLIPHNGPHQLVRVGLDVKKNSATVLQVEPIVGWLLEVSDHDDPKDVWLEPIPVTSSGASTGRRDRSEAHLHCGVYVNVDIEWAEIVLLWDAGRDVYLEGDSLELSLDGVSMVLRDAYYLNLRRVLLKAGGSGSNCATSKGGTERKQA
jgi:hypothetical protein